MSDGNEDRSAQASDYSEAMLTTCPMSGCPCPLLVDLPENAVPHGLMQNELYYGAPYLSAEDGSPLNISAIFC